MKKETKIMNVVLGTLVLTAGITGYQVNQQADTPASEVTTEAEERLSVSVVISADEEVLVEETVNLEEGTTVYELMDEHFEMEAADGFITSLEGVEQDMDANQYWMYEVDGEQAEVGAQDYVLDEDAEVSFELIQF